MSLFVPSFTITNNIATLETCFVFTPSFQTAPLKTFPFQDKHFHDQNIPSECIPTNSGRTEEYSFKPNKFVSFLLSVIMFKLEGSTLEMLGTPLEKEVCFFFFNQGKIYIT